jgi:uncharacterized membrane protein
MYSAPSENFEGLGRFIMGLLLLSAIVISLLCSFTLDILYKKEVRIIKSDIFNRYKVSALGNIIIYNEKL